MTTWTVFRSRGCSGQHSKMVSIADSFREAFDRAATVSVMGMLSLKTTRRLGAIWLKAGV
jgi:hypothetical protein